LYAPDFRVLKNNLGEPRLAVSIIFSVIATAKDGIEDCLASARAT
jgi:hypothetical protein